MLYAAAALFLIARKIAIKINHRNLWFLPFVFLALAVTALAYAPLPWGLSTLGQIAAFCVGLPLGWVGGLLNVPVAVIAGILLVLVLAFGAIDLLKDHKPDGWARTMLFATPVLVLLSTGSLAATVLDVIQTIGGVGPTIVAKITG